MEEKKGFWAEQWYKYRRKKTIWGIAFDFIFTALLIAMIIPSSRKVVSSTIIRYSMFQPGKTEEVIFAKESDYNWQVTSLDGEAMDMTTLQGKIVFLNFWATWCPPCIAELPSIQRLYNDYGDKIAFVLVSGEEASAVRRFMEKHKYTFPVFISKYRAPELFHSRNIPATFLLSQDGQVVMKKQGAARWDGGKVKALIDDLLLEGN